MFGLPEFCDELCSLLKKEYTVEPSLRIYHAY